MKRSSLILLRSALGAVLVAVALSGASAQAALTVNTTADSNAGGGCMGAPGDCSLRQAIAKAPAGETVIVPAGAYSLSFGSLSIGQALSVQGAGARTTSVVVASGPPHVFEVHSATNVTISGLTISAGHVTGTGIAFLHGGAVYNQTGSVLTLDAVAVTGTTLENTDIAGAAVRGAGIVNNGTLTLLNSTVSDNVEMAISGANQGAGLFNSGGTASIVNSTIAGNSQVAAGEATSSGAAIENLGTATALKNVTIAANAGSAAIDSNVEITARNTLVSNGASGNCSSPLTSLGHNLESAAECGFNAAGDRAGTDPLLGTLADNGGATDTVALLPGSPAIDAGDPADFPPSDQRGIARPQGSASDIGAFELVPAASPSNAFRFGRLRRNKRRGTAILTVILPGPGTVSLAGKGVAAGHGRRPAAASKAVGAAGPVKLPIRARGKAKRRLRRRGKVKLRVKVTYTPTGGSPNTRAKSVKLIRRPGV
jgi:hypothetical protein